MTDLAFVIPAHGRLEVSELAFAGIRWTLDELSGDGIPARALVVADDANLELARAYGFEALRRPNRPLGRRWNDGCQHVCETGADLVVACGSDDWVHPDLIRAQLAARKHHRRGAILCTRRSVVIAPDGSEATAITVKYPGGDGIRILPRLTLEAAGLRPWMDVRNRALDGGMSMALKAAGVRVQYRYVDADPFWIVDFKSGQSLTPYEKFPACEHSPEMIPDPFARLAEIYPPELVARAEAFYERAPVHA